MFTLTATSFYQNAKATRRKTENCPSNVVFTPELQVTETNAWRLAELEEVGAVWSPDYATLDAIMMEEKTLPYCGEFHFAYMVSGLFVFIPDDRDRLQALINDRAAFEIFKAKANG